MKDHPFIPSIKCLICGEELKPLPIDKITNTDSDYGMVDGGIDS